MRTRRRSRPPRRRRLSEYGTIPDLEHWWSLSWAPGPVSAPTTAVVQRDACIGCGQCASACPTGAISLGPDGKAVVDESLCRGCGICVKLCPVGAVQAKGGWAGTARRGD
jgi:MinD superfamily P-loop ATPase